MNVQLKIVFSEKVQAEATVYGGARAIPTIEYLKACSGLFGIYLSHDQFTDECDPRHKSLDHYLNWFL